MQKKSNEKVFEETAQARKEAFKMRLIDFSVSTLKICRELKKDPNLWSLCDQLIRSATSVGANINEAQGAGSRKDFANYFQIALKSARETRYWIQVLERYSSKIAGLKFLRDENEALINIIQASIKTLRTKL
jgi:four helix bundle protein